MTLHNFFVPLVLRNIASFYDIPRPCQASLEARNQTKSIPFIIVCLSKKPPKDPTCCSMNFPNSSAYCLY